MKQEIINFVHSPYNPQVSFTLGRKYEDIGQNSAAIAYFLRSAEFTTDKLISYECLCRIAICMERLGNRTHSTKGILLRAISLFPERPEAYWLLVKVYEKCEDWPECYAMSCVAEKFATNTKPQLTSDVSYPGDYAFAFQKAISSWWIGLFAYSIYLFKQLRGVTGMKYEFVEAVERNLKNLEHSKKQDIRYEPTFYPELRYKFPGAETIKENYSHSYQDMFVLSVLNGKRNGTFIEIGCGDPWYGSNTYLLEKDFGWKGLSIDINPEITKRFADHRKAKVITGDASMIDYNRILIKESYDYLQIDCEPADVSFKALKRVDLQNHRFAVITFEHDYFCDANKAVMEESRKYIKSFGYILVVKNVGLDEWSSSEDWWIHPDLVNLGIVSRMMYLIDSPVEVDKYMLNRL